ncbi:MAG: tRNA uridine 5-carboxymethylaminomethyl modification protein [Peptococcaceae bacterium BRH_c4b]|nr:MAG: tRNA uridine 5-carboxymethylaminomethyl modification protein [Peptococcaceae bacterium BRH_c4b]
MEYSAGKYDVIVVGGGHAGCEAGLAAARMGCKTLVVSLNISNIALMPCNPSVGGPAKGQLVREIDALGGEIGLNTDRAALQMRMLNTGKGPAVHALRAQADKTVYQMNMKSVLENQPNLDVKQVLVERLVVKNGRVAGVIGSTGAVFSAEAVILTTGTYLKGRIIIGDLAYPGGPSGNPNSITLSEHLSALGFSLLRFKTGTPARVDRHSIDFSKMSEQPGDEKLLNFSYVTKVKEREQISCWLTYTNDETHRIIRENLHRSPLYSGFIKGTGPRYCPSIEDKVVRFAERPGHQVFIEPEGRDTTEMYVQGMSTSLPEDVQLAMLRTLPGMEKVEIMRTGYAIEYDALDPTQLKLSLETKMIAGLFSAGQINGTSGYEEAAAQGLMAGLNAALHVKSREPLILSRSDAYIGVLIDDLVTKGTNEPYRLMTSRAEYRLLLRHDNADRRLTEKGFGVGLVDEHRYKLLEKKKQIIMGEIERLKVAMVPVTEKTKAILERKKSTPLQQSIPMEILLRRPEIDYMDLMDMESGNAENLPEEIRDAVEIEVKYEGYIKKQMAMVEKFERLESKKIPQDINYLDMKGVSTEAAQKLDRIRPESIGQAARISGVSPADISVLLIHLEQKRRLAEVKA